MARLTAEFRVQALIRRVHDAGGSAMVLAKGDAMAGGVLAIVQPPGGAAVLVERGLGDHSGLIRSGPTDGDESAILDYWRRRRERDPDLWVVEVIVADGERFVAETIPAN